MHSVAGKSLDADRNHETVDIDTPMGDSESDDEIFEDAMPQHTEVNEILADVHDISIDVDANRPHAQSFNYTDDLPTPPESSFAPSVQTAPSVHNATPLPRARNHPLPSGGQKEASLIFYLDRALENVGKRATNKHVKELLPGEVAGYKSIAEVVKDLDPLVDVVWVSSTPTLQLPYLISITVAAINCVPMFPPLPRITLNFLSKLDTAFAALISGTNPDTSEPLPGFKNNRGISTTDKVRVKGIVERARATVTKHLVGEEDEASPEINRTADNASNKDEGFVKFEGFDNSDDSDDEEEAHKRDEREVGHVFEKTIGELGDLLGGDPIGIVTDEEQDMRRQFEEEAAAMKERAAFEAEDQGVMEFEDEEEAMNEQRKHVEDGKKEFEDEAKWSGDGHEFQAHSAYAEKRKREE
ncbi:uncharacterized protein N0V89_002180 [Didymosphaeria variabile]|uniref:Uncharacterized protein n=1 Tax=Didymosphaeria variabile TaxID=1932322 RepID=A0A9W8XS72_9PLEO|nr:uncharacterized protein N0V89_002180 [Didymosphaeria variabile]KAJ4357604.1 hypothetical protein N0V89_002180 [Didymosphaeria variabile]